MVADVSESEKWKEINEPMGRCQIAVCREVDGVETASWRQMAVRVKMKSNRCINGLMSDSYLSKKSWNGGGEKVADGGESRRWKANDVSMSDSCLLEGEGYVREGLKGKA